MNPPESFGNKFGFESTTDELLEGIDLTGKRILVTGVSAGLGVEIARALVAHGAHVVGTVRDMEKGKKAIAAIQGSGKLELIELDLASLASVRVCAKSLLVAGNRFDVVIANAGVGGCPKGRTADGFETHFGTNHLGHFLFVNLIVSLMKPGSRLVNVSSAVHCRSDVDLNDLKFDRTEYDADIAYGRSKTANIQFTVEFDRRYNTSKGIRATAVNPGLVATELSRLLPPGAIEKMVEQMNANRPPGTPAITYKTLAQGAATTVWCAVVAMADEVGGKYCEDCHVVTKMAEAPTAIEGVRAYAIDPERAKALWAKSEELVGQQF